MASTADQGFLDSLLTFISGYAVEHFKSTGRRTDGAVLAEAIRSEFPGLRYDQLGLERLSDAVRLAEERGLVVRHDDVKHLELSPGPCSELPDAAQVTPQAPAPLPHVRPEVWRAFVFVSRPEHRFFDRETAQVLFVGQDDPSRQSSFESEDRYIRITPISASTQQEWMEAFVCDRESLVADEAPIRVNEWWLRFPEWLRTVDDRLEHEWNRFRTSKVLDVLREWASDSQVSVGQLLSPKRRIQTRATGALGRHSAGTSSSESEALRRAVLAAVSEMPLEDLERIALPVRYIVRHFKPC